MSAISTSDLDHEAARIYGALFGKLPPGIVISRFRSAVLEHNARIDPDDLAGYYRIIGRVGDLEAIELALRLSGGPTLLSTRFQIMVRLGETLPENQDLFVNRKRSRTRAVWAMVAGGFLTAFKLAKGFFLYRKYRHV